MIHLSTGLGRHAPLRAAVELLGHELDTAGGAGVPALVDLLLYILRAWFDDRPGAGGWALALRDPPVRAALEAVHREPARAGTVAELGRLGGLSRATFARRFTEQVGRPPLAYLTWWRMTVAARQLQDTDAPLSAVAGGPDTPPNPPSRGRSSANSRSRRAHIANACGPGRNLCSVSMVGGFFERIPHMLRAGVLAGLVVGIVLAPLGIALGMAAKAGSDRWLSVPNNLMEVPAGQTSYVYGADNQTLLTMFYEEHRRYLPIAEVPRHMQHAVIAAEDSRFFEHNGVDVKGLARAFVANQQAGEVSQGASTLTMQYVRMALRDSAPTPRDVIKATEQTPARKVREVRIALEIEKRLSKEEILERYLNTAYFGHRAYGVFAASEIYLSKRPADLTLAESALLAGLVKAPTDYDPAAQDSTAARDRRDWVLTQMAELRLVTPEEAEAAKREPLALKVYDPPSDCISAHDTWGFFCDLFKSWWMRQDAFGTNPNERLDRLRRGGYRIVTSIDPKMQAIARNEIASKESDGSVFAHGVVAIEPGTGLVKAMAINRRYAVDQSGNGPHTDPAKAAHIPGNYPNTVNPLLGGGDLPGYQAGSTFKLFTMLAALESGMPLTTSFHAPQRLVSIYLNDPGSPSSCGDRWCPVNASPAMTGTHNMWSGFGKSVNTYFVQLEQAVGAEKAVRMAERLGLRWRSETDRFMAMPERADGWGSFTLGVADTTPLEMANAIATVAADGKYCEPLPVASITAPDGGAVPFESKCHQAIPDSVARAATDAARCVTGYKAAGGDCGDWSTAPGVHAAVGRPVAGKTGTTDDTRAAWFIGFTPQLAAASFIADPDNPFNVVGDHQSHKPIQTVSGVLRDGLAGQPVRDFTFP